MALLGAGGLLAIALGAGVRIGDRSPVDVPPAPPAPEISWSLATLLDVAPPPRPADPSVRAVASPATAVPVVAGADDATLRWFDGRRIRPIRTMQMLVTAYSPDERSCGRFADGVTASGYSVWTNGMKLVAADTEVLGFGSLISVPGYDGGSVVPVLDRGGRIKGNRLDVLFPTHERARQWGVQELTVTIWDYADDT